MGRARYFVTLLLLGGAVFATRVGSGPSAEPCELLTQRIPLRVGEWSGADIEVARDTIVLLESSDVIVRRYAAPACEVPVFLTVAVSSRSRKVAHPPEICYRGYGFEIVRCEGRSLGRQHPRSVVLIEAVRGEEHEVVAGWYQAGEDLTASFVEEQLRLMAAILLGAPLRAAAIRLATPLPAGESFEDAVARLERFLDDVAPALGGALR
ncbi:MAG: exosortase C-terminal domain/associated protein EpsI [Planctomycetota bacterium]